MAARGSYEQACGKYAKAILEANPKDARAYHDWGVALGRLGKLREACAKYAKATRLAPKFAAAYAAWGRTLAKLGKHDEAAATLRRAADLDHALKPEIDKLLSEMAKER